MTTLAEIESAVSGLPRAEQAELLQFLAAQLRASAPDETDYLLSSPANREHLLRVVTDIEAGRELVEPDPSMFR